MKASLYLVPLVLFFGACEEEGVVSGGDGTEGGQVGGREGQVEGDAEDVGAGQGAPGGAVGVERPSDEDFVGLKVEEGIALAEKHDIPARVVKVDGEDLIVTQDYVEGRVNFTVEEGVIVEVKRG